MSVPGLVKSKLGTTSSIRTTASSSIAGAKRSNGASSAMSRTGTIFSGTGYGVYAQRSTTSLGLHNNYNLYYSAQTSALRHQLNDNRTPLFNNIYAPQTHQHEDKSNKFMGIMMGIGMGASLLGTILKGISDLKAADGSSTVDTTQTSGTGGKAKVKGDDTVSSKGDDNALSGMKNANDSTSLRAAIETATNKRSEMQTNLTELTSKLGDEKEGLIKDANDAKKQLGELNSKIKDKETEIGKQKEQVSQTQQSVKGLKQSVDAKLNDLNNFTDKRNTAETNLNTAASELSNARSTLSGTPQYIKDANGTDVPNEPAYSNAKQAVTNAEQKFEEAEKAYEQAKLNQTQANDAYDEALETYKAEDKKLAQFQKQLETQEQSLQTMQSDLDKLKTKKQEADNAIKECEDAIEQQKDLEADIKKYDSEIQKQQERLTKIEAEEAKEIKSLGEQMNSLAGKISERNTEIDASDGLNVREKMKMNRNERNSEKYARLSERQQELEMRQNYTKLYEMLPEHTSSDGTTFRKAEFGGEMLYMIGAKKVTEQEYNAKLQELGLG